MTATSNALQRDAAISTFNAALNRVYAEAATLVEQKEELERLSRAIVDGVDTRRAGRDLFVRITLIDDLATCLDRIDAERARS